MRNGPATFRPNEPVGKMAKRMQDRGATAVLVTTSGGKLVGLLYRKDVEQLAGARPYYLPIETSNRVLQYNQPGWAT